MGFGALQANTTASNNTAEGATALESNTTGIDNTATGARAMINNSSGAYNTAQGFNALRANTTGYGNTAQGVNALYGNTTGQSNIALGVNAGYNLTTGNNNIDIGNQGVAGEANTIRLGTSQKAAYIAGINGSAVMGADVVVDGAGRLGVVVSSARYKHDIRDMGATSEGMMKLRPVSFRYNNDPTATMQYGLVAEEVQRVYPELVTHDADGKVETVRYSMLSAMLLNELQKQSSREAQQAKQIHDQARKIGKLSAQLQQQKADFEQRLAAVERVLASKDGARIVSASAR